MRLPFLDRDRERARLTRAFSRSEGALVCLYGRRRLGKSRLLVEALTGRASVYFVGDDRDAALQRRALANEIGRMLPGFDHATYPDWDALLARWWADAPAGAVLALDEFPALVKTAPELPSLLQKRLDQGGRHVALSGSSQRMMLGLVLDATAPLYGRAAEILNVGPLPPSWLATAFSSTPREAVDHWALWGGVPRYWELALDFEDPWEALRELVLDPLGVLHREPERLLLDDLAEIARAASVLALVGAGCHRTSEIAGRLEVPSTDLSRPLARLVDLGFLTREIPFGVPARDAKRSLYRLADPFLALWYRWVEPNRSRLASAPVGDVLAEVRAGWSGHLGAVWEGLARESVAWLGEGWLPAKRWWGRGADGAPLELDLISTTADGARALVGEAKVRCGAREVGRLRADLEARARRCPALQGMDVEARVWVLEPGAVGTVGPEAVVAALA